MRRLLSFRHRASRGRHVVVLGDVIEHGLLEHSTASRLLGEAEVEGLVVRGTDPIDRRRTTLELTETGRMVLRESAVLRWGLIDALFAEWDPHDVQTLATLLGRVIATLSTKLPTSMHEALDRLGIELTEDH